MSTDQQFPTPNNLGIAVYSNNAEAIGNTPLVRINRLIKTGATILAKVESRNPAFSVNCGKRLSNYSNYACQYEP